VKSPLVSIVAAALLVEAAKATLIHKAAMLGNI
ncbi:uncharacterized protein METZ01_LOCUS94983, partial [marine metagenome]